MPISNAHLDKQVQVWDGLSYYMMDVSEAKKQHKAGTIQITKDLQAHSLKTAAQFDEIREGKKQIKTTTMHPPKGGAKSKGPSKKKQAYETREMKAK